MSCFTVWKKTVPQIAETSRKEKGVKTAFSNANLKEPQSINGLVEDTVNKFGKIDVLINNAGIQYVSKVEDFPLEKWNDYHCH